MFFKMFVSFGVQKTSTLFHINSHGYPKGTLHLSGLQYHYCLYIARGAYSLFPLQVPKGYLHSPLIVPTRYLKGTLQVSIYIETEVPIPYFPRVPKGSPSTPKGVSICLFRISIHILSDVP